MVKLATRPGAAEAQPGFCLTSQPRIFVRLWWAGGAPFSELCTGGLCRLGEAQPTMVVLYRVCMHQVEKGPCFLFKAGQTGALTKVTFMLSLTIAHIAEIQRICAQMSEAVKGRRKEGIEREWGKKPF